MKKRFLWSVALVVIAGVNPGHTQSNPIPQLPTPFDDGSLTPWPEDPPSIMDEFPASGSLAMDDLNWLGLPDLPPDPDPWDLPDPPEIDDPFPQPSHLDVNSQVLGHSPVAFTPEPLPLPFFPSFVPPSGGSTPSVGPCDPARSAQVFVPDIRGQVDVLGTCPHRNIRTIPLRFVPNVVRSDRAGTVLFVTGRDTPEAAIIDYETYAVNYVSLSSASGDVIASSVAFSADDSLVYITNHSVSNPFVAIFDMALRRVTGALTGIGQFPSRAAVSPDGTMLWVSCRGNGTVHVFDTRTNTKIAVFNVIEPLGITFDPAGTRAFVAAANDFAPGTIDVFDTEKLAKITSIPTGFVPQTILISPTGKHGFVNNLNSSFITQFDPVRLTFTRNITTKAPVSGFVFIRR